MPTPNVVQPEVGAMCDDLELTGGFHGFDIEQENVYLTGHGTVEAAKLQAKRRNTWYDVMLVEATTFIQFVDKWLADRGLTIVPLLDKNEFRCPKCGKKMTPLGQVFIEWGKFDGEYDEEGHTQTWKCECGFAMADLQHFDLDDEKVVLEQDDQDHHGAGCQCGLCNANGKSYGVMIRHRGSDECDVERVYAPSEEAAMHNARLRCQELGLTIKE